jgi:ADP-ribose pyrophosphatase YjhB (NUDIX family)
MCIFHHNGKILASKDFDNVKEQYYYRVLGGSVEFQESYEEAIRREIIEEIGSEIDNLKLMQVLENIFVCLGKKGHEIVFLYAGELKDKKLHEQEIIPIVENTYTVNAEWVPIENVFNGDIPLYPPFDYEKTFKELGYIK